MTACSVLLLPKMRFSHYVRSRLSRLRRNVNSRKKIDEFLSQSTFAKKGITVLDAGCGNMQYSRYAHNCNYIGVDFGKVDKYYPVDGFIRADLSSIPLGSSSVDLIWCIQVLEHVVDPERVLEELFRVSKVGGELYLTVPFIYQEHEAPYDHYRFTKYGLQSLLAKSGWSVQNIEPLEDIFTTQATLIKMATLVKSGRLSYATFLLSKLINILLNILLYLLNQLSSSSNCIAESTVVKNWKVKAVKC